MATCYFLGTMTIASSFHLVPLPACVPECGYNLRVASIIRCSGTKVINSITARCLFSRNSNFSDSAAILWEASYITTALLYLWCLSSTAAHLCTCPGVGVPFPAYLPTWQVVVYGHFIPLCGYGSQATLSMYFSAKDQSIDTIPSYVLVLYGKQT